MNGDSPPLAAALQVAATAWRRLREGASLDRALAAAIDGFAAATTTPLHPRLAAAASGGLAADRSRTADQGGGGAHPEERRGRLCQDGRSL